MSLERVGTGYFFPPKAGPVDPGGGPSTLRTMARVSNIDRWTKSSPKTIPKPRSATCMLSSSHLAPLIAGRPAVASFAWHFCALFKFTVWRSHWILRAATLDRPGQGRRGGSQGVRGWPYRKAQLQAAQELEAAWSWARPWISSAGEIRCKC